MANIKLTGHTWDTSGIWDTTEEKTQAEINAEQSEAIDNLTNSLFQFVEESTTATEDYPVGAFVFVDGILVEVLRPIASGGTFVLSDNCVAVQLDGEVNLISYAGEKTREMISDPVTSTTATKNYAVGDTFIYRNVLYVVIKPVAIGGTLTNSNCRKFLLADAINQVAEFRPSPNIFNNSFPNEGLIDTTGADSTSSLYMRTDYLPVDATNSTLYYIRDQQPYLVYLCFYDSTKTPINGRINVFTATTTAVKGNQSIPQNAAYYRLATHATNFKGTLCVSYSELSAVIPYDSISVISKTSSLYGKKIAFLGDSIVGNFDNLTGVCAQIANKTGAVVKNYGFGGSRMAYRYGDNIQYTYWNALSGYGLAQAIASGTWTDQDTAVANMTGGLDYFTDRLAALKAEDFSTVDYILWEYGTNDFSTEVKVSDTSDTTNMYAFDNAYRGAIEAISTAYPNIQIIPITPTWRFWQEDGTYIDDSNTHTMDDYDSNARLLTDFVEQVTNIAKEYQLPCIDDYYTLGANKFTKSAFFDATDGVHPNANGRTRIAEHIASQLDSVL